MCSFIWSNSLSTSPPLQRSSVRLSIRPSVRLSIHLSVHLSVSLSVLPSVSLSVHFSNRPFVRLFICPSIRPSAISLLAPSQGYSTLEEEEACWLWPEKKWLEEGKRRCCSWIKMEIMSLGFYLKVIYCLCVRSCANRVGFYTIPYIRTHSLGVGLSYVRIALALACLTSESTPERILSHSTRCRKESISCTRRLRTRLAWIGSIFYSCQCDLVSLYWFLYGNILYDSISCS